MILKRLLRSEEHKFPSFMKERSFYITVEKAKPNGNAIQVSFFDADTDKLVYEMSIGLREWHEMLTEYLSISFSLLEFYVMEKKQYSLKALRDALTSINPSVYTEKKEFNSDDYRHRDEIEDEAPRRPQQAGRPIAMPQARVVDQLRWPAEQQLRPEVVYVYHEGRLQQAAPGQGPAAPEGQPGPADWNGDPLGGAANNAPPEAPAGDPPADPGNVFARWGQIARRPRE